MAQWINVGTHKALNLDRITYLDAHVYPADNDSVTVTLYDNGGSYGNEPSYYTLFGDDAVRFLMSFQIATGVIIEPEVHMPSQASIELDSYEDDSPF